MTSIHFLSSPSEGKECERHVQKHQIDTRKSLFKQETECLSIVYSTIQKREQRPSVHSMRKFCSQNHNEISMTILPTPRHSSVRQVFSSHTQNAVASLHVYHPPHSHLILAVRLPNRAVNRKQKDQRNSNSSSRITITSLT